MDAVWTHYNPVRVITEAGSRARLPEFLPCGATLLITSAGMVRRGAAASLMDSCPRSTWTVRCIGENPDVDSLDALAAELRGTEFAAVVALGGGSVLDAAKALSVLLKGDADCTLERLLRKGLAQPLPQTPFPLFCLPTTAGTGAEVTPFATIWDLQLQKKHSLAGEQLFPQVVLLDAELTCTLPWDVTLYGALDTISHALETLWNRNATPISGTLAMQSLRMAVAALPALEQDQTALAPRETMQQASLLAGLAISQSRTALAHALSYDITLKFGIPHGYACSFSLPVLTKWVQHERAWKVAPDEALLRDIQHCFETYAVQDRVMGKCSREELLRCIRSVFSSDRHKNFVLDVSAEAIEDAFQKYL